MFNAYKEFNVDGFANRLKYQGSQFPKDKIKLNAPENKKHEISMVSQFEVSKN